jgi:hypothetical protein
MNLPKSSNYPFHVILMMIMGEWHQSYEPNNDQVVHKLIMHDQIAHMVKWPKVGHSYQMS